MRILTLLMLLFAIINATLAYDDPYEEGEDDNADGALDPEDDTPGGIGDRCGGSNPCEEGLDCVRSPVLRRCYPVTCGLEAVKASLEEEGFDMAVYGREIMDLAGVTEESTMFRTYPNPTTLELFNREGKGEEDVQAISRAIQDYHPDLDKITQRFYECAGPKATVLGLTPYIGLSWELGALATYNGDLFWGQGTADAVGLGLLNNCFGVVLGYDAGISGLIGLAFTGTIQDLANGCKQAFPIAAFPPFELQLGVILGESLTFLMEFTGGASASAGLPGFTTCTTTVL